MKVYIVLLLCAFAAAQHDPSVCIRDKLQNIYETSLSETIQECINDNPKYYDLTKRVEMFTANANAQKEIIEACGNNLICLLPKMNGVFKLQMELFKIRVKVWQAAANIDSETRNCIQQKVTEAYEKLSSLIECMPMPF